MFPDDTFVPGKDFVCEFLDSSVGKYNDYKEINQTLEFHVLIMPSLVFGDGIFFQETNG